MERSYVITGGSAGIGAALYNCLTAAGHAVVRSYRSHAVPGGFPLDLGSEGSIDAVSFAPGAVLINNAGVLVRKPFAVQSRAEIHRQMGTNLTGTLLLTQRYLQAGGREVVFIGSDLSKIPHGGLAVYTATKHALRGFARSLADEDPALRVLFINPRRTATAMNDFEGEAVSAVAEKIAAAIAAWPGQPFCEVDL